MDLLSFALILLAFWIAIAFAVATALACAAGRADETRERLTHEARERLTHEARERWAARRETAPLDHPDRKPLDVLAGELTPWGPAATNVNFAERRMGGRDVATSHFKNRSRITPRPQRATKLLH